MRFPTQLMLYEKIMQLMVSINMRHKAYCQSVATISPNPTVSIMLIPQ
jgi:hypothetical protein